MDRLSIKNSTSSALGRARGVFSDILRTTLPSFDISLVFVTATHAKALNRTLRKKRYTPNVLSYLVGPKSGEIIICPAVVRKEAPEYGLSPDDFVLYLFIHGLLHLKGWAHGARMEASEQKLLARFATSISPHLNETTHRNRNRHRHVSGQSGRSRRNLR